ncbi:MAG TPA: type 4b pilus protein PilO2 [Noviherbaspirillum sp.]|nr:type 4b pilus protein PilO2 [Noviherbaspirillum sp.]
MATHIIQIGKHKFICGLFWQSLSRPRELKKEAKDLANKIDSDLLVVIRDQTMAQAGFAHTRDGARRMTYSLAAAISKTLSEEGGYYDGRIQPVHDWLGAFKLPDGMWAYFAVRDANFLPNGDFAGTREEVLDRLHGDYGLGGWNMVVGDAELEEYGFHNFDARSIEELIPHTKNGQIKVQSTWALRPVKTEVPAKAVIAGTAAAAILAAGGAYYWHTVQKQREAEERDRAIEAARQKMLSGAAPATPVKPWPGKPAPLAAARACVEKFTHIVPGGWQLDTYECNGTRALYTWSRQTSTIELLLAQVPGATIDFGGDKATYSEPLQPEPGKDDALLAYKELVEPILSRLQTLKLALKLARPAAPPAAKPALSDIAAKAPPPAEWQTITFNVATGGLSPVEVARVLDRPGVRLDKIAYKGGAWSMEGVMYAK